MLVESSRRLSWFVFALFSIYRNGFCQSLATWNTMREGGLQQKLKQLTKNNAMIILDGDNIRGKTRFKLSKEGKIVEGKRNVLSHFLLGSLGLYYTSHIRAYLIINLLA
jgi:hypothetical protein